MTLFAMGPGARAVDKTAGPAADVLRATLDSEQLWREEKGALEQEVAQDLSGTWD